MMNRLQNYFGIAIRATCKTSVPTMRMAVGAVLFHCSEAVDSAGRHQFCPKSTIYFLVQISGRSGEQYV